ncbi:unnamed protein product [Paramecium octaurelia]|uniref:Tectonic-1-3 N-terminal domain-containing protein n=1 Tax=Paramecium octaurelia TaxID=43137 RepID=A0A8S1W406_PAROT|nr:unnamed protein product [Paramecium octaurelia]
MKSFNHPKQRRDYIQLFYYNLRSLEQFKICSNNILFFINMINFILFFVFLNIIVNGEIVLESFTNVQQTNDNSTFNIQNDEYCFCNLKVREVDDRCCCDPDISNTSSTLPSDCLLGSVKRTCIKKYILSRQNVDQWIQVEEQGNQICFIYEKSSLSTSGVTMPQAYNNPTYLQDYFKVNIIPETKVSKADALQVAIYQTNDKSNILVYRDSNGICKQTKRFINYKQIQKQSCLMLACQTNLQTITSTSASTQFYSKSSTVFTLSATKPGGCLIGQSVFMGTSAVTTTPSFTSNTFAYFSSDQTLYNYVSEVVYANASTNSNFQGKAGYDYGQYVQGHVNLQTNPFGYKIYRGKASTSDSTCTLSDDQNPLNYEPLRFGQNLQFSCSYSLNQTTISTFSWSGLQIFNSFPYSTLLGLARTPLFGTSSLDFVNTTTEVPQTDYIYFTQHVLIFTDEFGMKEGRQNYISSFKIVYSNAILKTNIPADTKIYRFNLKVRFINLPHDDIENSVPQDPPFIPQLPSDIFFPIWYETFGSLISTIMIVFIFYI